MLQDEFLCVREEITQFVSHAGSGTQRSYGSQTRAHRFLRLLLSTWSKMLLQKLSLHVWEARIQISIYGYRFALQKMITHGSTFKEFWIQIKVCSTLTDIEIINRPTSLPMHDQVGCDVVFCLQRSTTYMLYIQHIKAGFCLANFWRLWQIYSAKSE